MSRDLDHFRVILYLKCATLCLTGIAFGLEYKGPESEDNYGSPMLTANVYSIWVTVLVIGWNNTKFSSRHLVG